jgi:hypothetical protein
MAMGEFRPSVIRGNDVQAMLHASAEWLSGNAALAGPGTVALNGLAGEPFADNSLTARDMRLSSAQRRAAMTSSSTTWRSE